MKPTKVIQYPVTDFGDIVPLSKEEHRAWLRASDVKAIGAKGKKKPAKPKKRSRRKRAS